MRDEDVQVVRDEDTGIAWGVVRARRHKLLQCVACETMMRVRVMRAGCPCRCRPQTGMIVRVDMLAGSRASMRENNDMRCGADYARAGSCKSKGRYAVGRVIVDDHHREKRGDYHRQRAETSRFNGMAGYVL